MMKIRRDKNEEFAQRHQPLILRVKDFDTMFAPVRGLIEREF